MIDYNTTTNPKVQQLDSLYTVWENRILVQKLLQVTLPRYYMKDALTIMTDSSF